ncbi:MAG TPA: 1-acyl-sn-glycerol-3-phosphate acyltransferase [Bacteroidales bacterium]|nr:1-acyl-sn-glycerol-3-phosphate acyltransferase [Bacteroidales bacterium]HRR49013.1 1-acyl-sn-glycerol-3-phosphate acyltransferase [Bacteroidales bacterium]HRT33150.1 1-acyl-sn-glycerol-3-phosphate acyltransferase [Bacteroidales bacterium]HRT83182.1 1-acyl-sn-glycerol-3-phosphate acyltransferase [Bacteroidales bacterium]
MENEKFSEIRPFNDFETREAMLRISKHPLLSPIIQYLFPDKNLYEMREHIASLKTVDEFQAKVMSNVIQKIISDTSRNLTYSDVERFKDNKKHLLISNHRDILLDSAIIQLIFFVNGIQTSEMAVGDNLITDVFIEDIARSNKMIKVERNKNPRDFYNSSILLSHYIRETITSGRSSVWIAQRNGRTKDGKDMTEQGLLKMFDMSAPSGDFVEDFNDLSIVPVSISYEYEPCDLLKTKELYISRRRKYEKAPGEDLNSILTGIMQFKGNIHVNFCDTITREELTWCSNMEKNDRYKNLAEIIDRKIISSYKLFKNNYIAYDLLNHSNKYSSYYSESDRQSFLSYINYKLSGIDEGQKEMEEIFLTIYSGPVFNNERIEVTDI